MNFIIHHPGLNLAAPHNLEVMEVRQGGRDGVGGGGSFYFGVISNINIVFIKSNI